MDKLSDRVLDALGAVFSSLFGEYAVIAWLALGALIAVGLRVRRYYLDFLEVASAPDATQVTRDEYAQLRLQQFQGGGFARAYEQSLKASLDTVDRFFKDAGKAHLSWPSPFGNKEAVPFWTADAYDRCLLLALIYPLGCIFFVWVATGAVGPIEEALGVPNGVPTWARLVACVCVIGATWGFLQAQRARTVAAALFAIGVLVVAIAVALGVATVVGVDGVLSLDLGVTAAFLVACTLLFNLVHWLTRTRGAQVVGAGAVGVVFAASLVFAGSTQESSRALALAVGGGAILASVLVERLYWFLENWRGWILLAFTMVALVGAPLAAYHLAPFFGRHADWTPLALVAFFAVVNAPFDWFSLGLTRAALRRALETPTWVSFALWSVVDAVIACFAIVLLMFVAIMALGGFNAAVVLGGGEPPVPISETLLTLRERPTAPSVWWVYATIFSTLVPSFVNLLVGGASLARSVFPGVVLSDLPENRDVPVHRRKRVAEIVMLQWMFGAVFAVVATSMLFFAIGSAFPRIGHLLLDWASAFADLPVGA